MWVQELIKVNGGLESGIIRLIIILIMHKIIMKMAAPLTVIISILTTKHKNLFIAGIINMIIMITTNVSLYTGKVSVTTEKQGRKDIFMSIPFTMIVMEGGKVTIMY